jgi:uncharacterized protein (UPF0248 family)
LWDERLRKEDFTVIYEDRFLGLLEKPVDDFLATETKQHRIWQFKCKGEVVWDKERRIDITKELFK